METGVASPLRSGLGVLTLQWMCMSCRSEAYRAKLQHVCSPRGSANLLKIQADMGEDGARSGSESIPFSLIVLLPP
eukprot:4783381-Amphidinium_carterae.1